jgi:hypothetical protein
MTTKIYFVRHQHGHANEQVAFAKPPTEAQINAVLDHDDARYGNKCDDDWRKSDSRVMVGQLVTDDSIPKL